MAIADLIMLDHEHHRYRQAADHLRPGGHLEDGMTYTDYTMRDLLGAGVR